MPHVRATRSRAHACRMGGRVEQQPQSRFPTKGGQKDGNMLEVWSRYPVDAHYTAAHEPGAHCHHAQARDGRHVLACDSEQPPVTRTP